MYAFFLITVWREREGQTMEERKMGAHCVCLSFPFFSAKRGERYSEKDEPK
jgi:hypothetical protein